MELIKVTYDNDRSMVPGRELHKFLEGFSDFQDFYVAVCNLKMGYDVDGLSVLRKEVALFTQRYNPDAVVYLLDSIDMEKAFLRGVAQNQRPHQRNEVYVVGFTDGTVKVGVSANALKRINTVTHQAGRKRLASRTFSVPSDRDAFSIEAAFKSNFKTQMVNGEIFKLGFQEACSFVNKFIGEGRKNS